MSPLDDSCHLISLQSFAKSNSQCNNVDIESNAIQSFMSNFDLGTQCAHLSDSQFSDLSKTLYAHKNLFVTKDNPGLGFTTLVQHHIHLKPDVKSKHQHPYRLNPDKKEVLRHHLQELLSHL